MTVMKFEISDLTEQNRKRKKSQHPAVPLVSSRGSESLPLTSWFGFPFIKFSEPIYNQEFPQNSNSERLQRRSNQTAQWLPPSATGNTASIRSEVTGRPDGGDARSDSGEEDKTFRCVVYLQIGARPFGGRRLRAQNPLRFFGQVLQHDTAPDRKPSAQTDTHPYASL